MGRSGPLDPAECLRLLGLPEAASAVEIKRAYRRLAGRFHPDKTGGDPAARAHFIAVSRAYRNLMRRTRLISEGRQVGTCCVCREFGEAVMGLDGQVRCPACALRPGGRILLPMPSIEVVRCVGVFVLLGVGLYLLARTLRTGDIRYALGGLIASLSAFFLLAVTCLRVLYCIQPREEQVRRAAQKAGRPPC